MHTIYSLLGALDGEMSAMHTVYLLLGALNKQGCYNKSCLFLYIYIYKGVPRAVPDCISVFNWHDIEFYGCFY